MAKYLWVFLSLFLATQSMAAPKGVDPNGGKGSVTRVGFTSAPQGTPTRVVLDIEDKMKQYKTQKPLSPQDKAYNANLKREILEGGFDLHELCKQSLDKHWAARSAGEQSQFVGLMTQILEKKALFSNEQSKAKGKKYRVNYQGDTYSDGKTKALTKVHIRTHDNAEVNIHYRFRLAGSQWKIYDVIVDEASLIENYRYQFDSIIKKHGYGELVSRMQKKLQEMN